MFEYMNYGGLSVVGFITASIILLDMTTKSEKASKGYYIFLAIMFGLLLLDANNRYKTAQVNIHDFKNRDLTLKCIVGGGMYSTANKYKVSKNDGWSLDGRYFVKESLLVDASRCERW